MKRALSLLLVFCACFSLPAQTKGTGNDNFLQAGIKAGAGYSGISDLSKMLVSESYYTGYTFTNKGVASFTGGLYINYKFKESISAFYAEVSYSRIGNILHYSDVNNLEYDLEIKYDYINIDFWYKAYLVSGLYIGVGPRIGFNLTPGGLYYTSNGEAIYGPDIRIQQQMRDVLKGRTNFALGLGLGYEMPFGLAIDARYYFGISDVIETEVNNFHFIENKNSSHVLQITIGYSIPYNMKFF